MILGVAGLPAPGDRVLDGIDPTAILAGTARATDRMLFWEYPSSGKNRQTAVRHDRFKLMRPGPGKPFALFDLVADPGEWRDISARYPDVVARLFAAYERWLAETAGKASEHSPVVIDD